MTIEHTQTVPLDQNAQDYAMQQIDRQLNDKHLLKHPLYQAWSAGKLSIDDIKTYACQYYHHVEAFPHVI